MLALVERVRGFGVLMLAAISLGYGFLIIRVLPYWDRLAAVEGGRELQERFHYSATDAAAALSAVDGMAREEAFIFYALDVPNALLYGFSLAAMIAFGLRQLRRDGAWRWVLWLPLASAGADLVENALLTAALLTDPATPGPLHAAAGYATALKFAAGFPAQILAVLGVLVGLIIWLARRM